MYRLSPFTYLVAGVVATGLHSREIHCAANELSVFDPPKSQTCGQYLSTYLSEAPGRLIDASATSLCQCFPLTVADQFLATTGIYWSQRWKNFGIVWAYILFNVFAAVGLYWAFRVHKWSGESTKRGAARIARLFVGMGL